MRPDNMPRPHAPEHSEGTTHGEGCHTWGTRHYECAMRELARKDAEIALLNGTMRADEERLLQAGQRVGIIAGCDTPEQLADAIEHRDAEIAELRKELHVLRQACWDARAILGFDNDGNTAPEALVYPTMAELVLRDAKEFRADHDAALRDAERAEARVREAPVAEVIRRDCMNTCIFAPEDDELQARIDALHGKRVALVLLDTDALTEREAG